ncbi:MAG: alginate O-acetyltransferase [Nevskia sp.]|nr:alginate O-acetyltransferase [Nevskia sp.]
MNSSRSIPTSFRSSKSVLRRWRALALASLVAVAADAGAGLYPPAAPPGSAFVRVFNATSQAKISAQVGDKALPDTPAFDASAYQFVQPGDYPAKLAGSQQNLHLAGSRCYTAALTADGVHVFDQDCFNSQLKALVSVFNLVDGTTLSLRTADGATAVVDNVAANSAGHREVNAVKIDLAIYNGNTKLADAKPVALERGRAYSLFVTGTAAQPVPIWIVN